MSGDRGDTASAVAPEHLRIALPRVQQGLLVHLAQARDYVADEGLVVDFVPAVHGKEAVALVADTVAIDVEPLDSRISATMRMV